MHMVTIEMVIRNNCNMTFFHQYCECSIFCNIFKYKKQNSPFHVNPAKTKFFRQQNVQVQIDIGKYSNHSFKINGIS